MDLMVIDTSAVVAILFEEEDQISYAKVIEDASLRLVSAVARVELSFLVEGRNGTQAASCRSASLRSP